ncbi:MAG TPA: hypothetical protein VNT32_12640 [Thermoleophilaceae bacterium]|nr:hypothetical protein [Thermoleophilaceae bacterium]
MSEREQTDTTAEREAELASAEAGAIGGPDAQADLPEAERPVAEAGGGEAEGFEQAEEMHRERAENLDAGAKPHVDAPAPEAESDRSSAEYGEADDARPAG